MRKSKIYTIMTQGMGVGDEPVECDTMWSSHSAELWTATEINRHIQEAANLHWLKEVEAQ